MKVIHALDDLISDCQCFILLDGYSLCQRIFRKFQIIRLSVFRRQFQDNRVPDRHMRPLVEPDVFQNLHFIILFLVSKGLPDIDSVFHIFQAQPAASFQKLRRITSLRQMDAHQIFSLDQFRLIVIPCFRQLPLGVFVGSRITRVCLRFTEPSEMQAVLRNVVCHASHQNKHRYNHGHGYF